MIPSSSSDVVAAIATANGHTVCLLCNSSPSYALFDPLPGILLLGLDAKGLLRAMAEALLPASAVAASKDAVADDSLWKDRQCDISLLYLDPAMNVQREEQQLLLAAL